MTPLSVDTVPLPSFNPPLQTALALRFIDDDSLSQFVWMQSTGHPYLVKAKQNAVPLPTAEPHRFSCGLLPARESPVQRALKYAGIH